MSKKSKLRIVTLEEYQYSDWNNFVLGNRHASLFHTTHWLSCIGGEIKLQIVLKGDEILGGCALVKTVKKGVSGYHVPPLTPYFGPVLTDNSSCDQTLKQKALSLLLTELPKSGVYDFILTPYVTDLLPYIWAGFTPTVRYTYTVNGTVEAWAQSINKNKARDYRKAKTLVEEGRVSLVQDQQLNQVLSLVQQTQSRKQVTLINDAYNKIFASPQLAPYWYTQIVQDQHQQPLCGSLIANDQFNCYYLLNGRADNLPNELKNTNLLAMGSAIEGALHQHKTFDFEGSMISGIELYFRLLGGVQRPIYRVQKATSNRFYAMRAINQWRKERAGRG